MKNETFAETLKRVLDKCDYKETAIFTNGELEVYEKVFFSFKAYGDFLNCIPIEEREIIIYNDIHPWLLRYAANDFINTLNRLQPIKKEAKKEIRKNINIIEKFENMLSDNFSPMEETIKLNNSLNIPNNKQDLKTIEVIKTLLSTTNHLKDDLSNGDFKIFPKHIYYAYDPEYKQNLTKILHSIVDKYKIKNAKGYITIIQQNI